MLASNAGVQRFYRGLIRNVEQTDDPTLLEAQGRIADVVAKDAKKFLARLKKEDSCFLLHLSEGVTDPANPKFIHSVRGFGYTFEHREVAMAATN